MKHKNRISTSCLALALAGSAQAGVWTSINWTGDSALSFITNSNVTHSVDFAAPSQSAASINGFTFETKSISAGFGFFMDMPYSGHNFTIGGTGSQTYDASVGVPGTASTALSTGLIFGAGTITYNLTGLSTNTNYEFYFFSPDWSDLGRTGVLDGSDDGVGNTITTNQSWGSGHDIIKYAYNTGASTSFTMTVNDPSGVHQFAFVNVVSPDGVWNTTTNGALWTLDTNWVGNVIADGTGKTAAFNQVDITADTAVDLDGNRTIGNLIFGDTDTSNGGSWTLNGGGGALTLAGGTPTITVNALATDQAVTMNAGLSGTSGFTKNGTGMMYLAGGTSNTLSGPITVSAGRLGSMDSASLQNMTGDITVASGATFDVRGHWGVDITNNFILSGTGDGSYGHGALNIMENASLTGAITLTDHTKITHDWNIAYVSASITGTNTNLELKTLQSSQFGFFMGGPISLGTGSLTLTGIGTASSADFDFSGTLNYTGETVITSGTMRLSGPARLPDSSTVRITSGAVLNLDFAGTDTVAALYLNGALMPAGTYGSLASTATNKSADFEGAGILGVGGAPTPSYSTWASANGISGQPASGDFDYDGLTNLVEYALDLSPTVSSVPPGTFNGSLLSFNKGTEAMANGDVTYEIEQSTTLGGWTVVVPNAPASASISYTLPGGQPKEFARLKITQIP
jgi:autotransporter-associated beta strand protein